MSLARSLLILSLAFVLLPLGCKKDEDSPTSPGTTGIPASLVGTWTLQSATVNGQPADLAVVFNWVEGTQSASITVAANGAYTYKEFDAGATLLFTSAGTITVSGASFTISVTSENGQALPTPETLSGTWALAGNALTLTIASQLGPVVVIATK
jgi:hypothetical protein